MVTVVEHSDTQTQSDSPSSPTSEYTDPLAGMTTRQVADLLNVTVRSVERARFIGRQGIADVIKAVMDGKLKLGPAEKIARLPVHKQLHELEFVLSGKHRSARPTRDIENDLYRICDLINRLAPKWSEADRQLARIVLTDWGRELVEGRNPDDIDEGVAA